jgi:hypothetical protein
VIARRRTAKWQKIGGPDLESAEPRLYSFDRASSRRRSRDSGRLISGNIIPVLIIKRKILARLTVSVVKVTNTDSPADPISLLHHQRRMIAGRGENFLRIGRQGLAPDSDQG